MWRSGCRSYISVSASFVWRYLSGSTVAPFPHRAHRTGQADYRPKVIDVETAKQTGRVAFGEMVTYLNTRGGLATPS
jgi:hypothetical protein